MPVESAYGGGASPYSSPRSRCRSSAVCFSRSPTSLYVQAGSQRERGRGDVVRFCCAALCLAMTIAALRGLFFEYEHGRFLGAVAINFRRAGSWVIGGVRVEIHAAPLCAMMLLRTPFDQAFRFYHVRRWHCHVVATFCHDEWYVVGKRQLRGSKPKTMRSSDAYCRHARRVLARRLR